MLQNSADQIQSEKNYLLASHIDGAWERQVWSARNMLSPLEDTQSKFGWGITEYIVCWSERYYQIEAISGGGNHSL